MPDGVAESRRLLEETTELLALDGLTEGGLSFHGTADISATVAHCAKGGCAGGEALLELATTLGVARRLRREIEDPELRPVCSSLVAALRTLPELERRLHFCLEEGGRVADRASPPLERLRHQLRFAREERRARLQESMRRYASLLQDTVIAERNGRPVLAVKAAAAGQVPGLVHDSSASGLTVLVEPQAVISQGNRIRDLEGQERELERAVLQELSGQVGEEADSLIHLQAVMVALDGALARARYGQWLGAVRPVLEVDPLAPFELLPSPPSPAALAGTAGGRGGGGAGERRGEPAAAGRGDHRPQHRRQDRDPQKCGAGGPDGPGRLVSPLRGHPTAALVRPGAGRHRR